MHHVNAVGLRSRVVGPSGSRGARPGLVVFPGWWGVDDYYATRRGRELAAAGCTLLVADMYRDASSTRDAEEAAAPAASTCTGPSARTRAADAVGALAAEGGVDPARIAAIGFCFGGSVALDLARSGAPLAAAVALHASLATAEPSASGAITASPLVLHGCRRPARPDRAGPRVCQGDAQRSCLFLRRLR